MKIIEIQKIIEMQKVIKMQEIIEMHEEVHEEVRKGASAGDASDVHMKDV